MLSLQYHVKDKWWHTVDQSSDSISSANQDRAFFCEALLRSGTQSCSPLPPSAPGCWLQIWRHTNKHHDVWDNRSVFNLIHPFRSCRDVWHKPSQTQFVAGGNEVNQHFRGKSLSCNGLRFATLSPLKPLHTAAYLLPHLLTHKQTSTHWWGSCHGAGLTHWEEIEVSVLPKDSCQESNHLTIDCTVMYHHHHYVIMYIYHVDSSIINCYWLEQSSLYRISLFLLYIFIIFYFPLIFVHCSVSTCCSASWPGRYRL